MGQLSSLASPSQPPFPADISDEGIQLAATSGIHGASS
jgi:hypothetical protein